MSLPETFKFCPRCGKTLQAGGGGGDTAGNPACGACGFVQWSDPKLATGVVVEHDGRVLLVRRNHDPMYGRWSFPSGFVDSGEVVEEAAAREVREETGVEVWIDRLLGVYSSAGDHVVFVAFAGTSTGTSTGTSAEGVPTAGSDEVMETGLFAPDELPEMAFVHDTAILDAWREWRAWRERPAGRD
ncbi:MAG: NUDIX domain-containing protein [Dehalococcoidia bacterium]|jgi:ADP-ribose pyrophosphatase YjhB (NUDIX family)|nr:NUDIX domain-containing protein [Dehalococcoidia bacterium]